MISSSTSLPNVLKSICDFDVSIKYDPIRFIGFIKDLYCGNNLVADDFISVLIEFESIIREQSISSKDLSRINIKGQNSVKRCSVQSELLKNIYLNKRPINVNNLDKLVSNAYEKTIPKTQSKSYNRDITSSILSFKASSVDSIEYGRIITLTWKCSNPYRVTLFNGNEYMDVTNIDTIQVSAMFDRYVLSLYDKNGKIIDEKEITLQFRKNSFCINCGTLIYHEGDKFCTHCGCRL